MDLCVLEVTAETEVSTGKRKRKSSSRAQAASKRPKANTLSHENASCQGHDKWTKVIGYKIGIWSSLDLIVFLACDLQYSYPTGDT